MLKILERYIAKTILFASGLALLTIVSVLFLITVLGELKNIGEGDYGLFSALMYVLLRLPGEIYQFSPMLILIGSILGLSLLTSNRELSVMRASGFSMRQITQSVLLMGLCLTLGIGIMGEWLGPTLSYKAETKKEYARNSGQAVITSSGIWMHVENNFIHVQQVVGRQLFEDVTRYEFDDQHHLKAAYHAKKLAYANKQWHMYDGLQTTFTEGGTKSERFAEADWHLKFNPNLLKVGLEPKEMSLPQLSKLTRYLKKNGLQATDYQYEFWQRVFQPFASLVMVFLAIPFVLGIFSRTTIGWRVFGGLMTGFGFFILNALLGQLCIVYQLPIIIAASSPLLLFAIFGFFLSHRLLKNS